MKIPMVARGEKEVVIAIRSAGKMLVENAEAYASSTDKFCRAVVIRIEMYPAEPVVMKITKELLVTKEEEELDDEHLQSPIDNGGV